MSEQTDRRVTFLLNSFGVGGAERVCHILSNGLADRGWYVDIVTLFQDSPVPFGKFSPSVSHTVLGCRHARTSMLPLSKYILRQKPKLVVPWIYGLAVSVLLLRRLGLGKFSVVPRNVTNMTYFCHFQPSLWQKKVAPFLARFAYSSADHYIAQCESMREDMISHWGIRKSSVSVIPNPVAQDYLSFVLEGEERSSPPELLFVGRLQPPKGIHHLVKILGAIRQKRPDVVLRVIGDGPDRAMLERYALEHEGGGGLIVEGWKNDLPPYYRKASATVLTSDCEGFPNVLLESLAVGTPVVAFDCPSGPREIIRNGVDGYLVEPGNIEQFVIRCLDVMKWPPLQRDTRFSAEKIIDRYENVLLKYC